MRKWLLLLLGLFQFDASALAQTTILNVSYDPTRELYREIDAAFALSRKKLSGDTVKILASHGGSGKQARAVIDGLEADVVTLALQSDIDAIVKKSGRIAKDWRSRLPNNSCPYTSTIVFLVREGNPKGISDWDSLVYEGIEVIMPNPKVSGGARWNYLAAWAWADRKFGGDEARIKHYISDLYSHVPVLDTGARGSTTTFARREIGDVLVTWENEAWLALDAFGEDQFDIVTPSVSILAEPPVAVVDANVDEHGTRETAEAYLQFLYSDEGQTLIAKHHYRPSNSAFAKSGNAAMLPDLERVSIDDPVFGGWAKAQPYHFGDDGVFDQIYKPAN